MRRFGTDKPQFFCFNIGESDKVYKMPLAASLPAKEILAMQKAYKTSDEDAFEYQCSMIEHYVGDTYSELTANDIGEIFKAWNEESTRIGASVGES